MSQNCVNLFNSWTTPVQRENKPRHKSKVKFTVTSLHIEVPQAERKLSMEDLSPAWNVQPDFVKLDYPWIRNSSEYTVPPLVPHIIHQVSRVTCRFNRCQVHVSHSRLNLSFLLIYDLCKLSVSIL